MEKAWLSGWPNGGRLQGKRFGGVRGLERDAEGLWRFFDAQDQILNALESINLYQKISVCYQTNFNKGLNHVES